MLGLVIGQVLVGDRQVRVELERFAQSRFPFLQVLVRLFEMVLADQTIGAAELGPRRRESGVRGEAFA